MAKKLLRGLAVGAAAFLASVLLDSLNVLRPLEWKSWDLRLRLLSRPSQASGDIVLILSDQESLDVYEKSQGMPWPWPRQMYAVFVDYLKAGGAKALFLDLILSETSRYGVEDDEILSRAMAASGNVFVPFFMSGEAKDEDADAVRELKRFSLPVRDYPKKAIQPLDSVSLPVEVLLRAAAGAG